MWQMNSGTSKNKHFQWKIQERPNCGTKMEPLRDGILIRCCKDMPVSGKNWLSEVLFMNSPGIHYYYSTNRMYLSYNGRSPRAA